MGHSFCPGAKILRQPAPEIFTCPNCGGDVEIWTDEFKRVCPECKKTVIKNANMQCLDWCKHAEDCVGSDLYGRYMNNKSDTIKQKLLEELEQWFGNDKKRINHAKHVLEYAEKLMQTGKADPHIIIPASILHDVGIKTAEEKYGSSAGRYQEIEGPPVARKILLKIGLSLDEIDEICEIIAHHHTPGRVTTDNFQVVYEADWLENLGDDYKDVSLEKKKRMIEKNFKTETGKKLAEEKYLE